MEQRTTTVQSAENLELKVGTIEKDEDSSASSSEETEPKLKYERLTNDVHNMLKKDSASCVAFHPKIICVGTRWGVVHLFDHQGNMVQNEHLRAHTVAVNQISMDKKGDFIATCSDDGKVYVYGLYTSDHFQEISISRSIKSVAIDPEYYKLGIKRRFITGDDRLILHEKTFLSRIKSTVLYEAVGRVQNISWNGPFVAWTCDVGVRVYDIHNRCSLVLIKWSRTETVHPENYPCCLCWKNSSTLLIGWVDTVRICKIEKRNSVIKEIPNLIVNPISTFQTEFFISGIGPLDDELVILGYSKQKDKSGKSLKPLMCILRAESSTKYADIYTDNLSLRGFEEYSCTDYHLECIIVENRFIIVCPKDIIIASLHDTDDRIEWLVDHQKFEEAMDLVSDKKRFLIRNSLLTVGRKYLDFLLTAKEYEKAGLLCSKIFLGTDKSVWEEEVFKFARVGQLRAISDYLPIDLEKKLNPHIYEMVLFEFLKIEPEGFLKIIEKWSPNLYNIYAVINAVLEHIVSESNYKSILLKSLAILYTHSDQYEKALNIYLNLKNKDDVFLLIRKHNLYNSIHEMIENLMDLNPESALSILLDKNHISPDIVVSKLIHNKYYLYLYLDGLDKKDTKGIGKKYHGTLVKLYADFAPQKLLPLLKRSDNYPIQEALDICKKNNLFPEMVYLLGRIGNTKEALELVINQIGDIEQAITFCKEHDDQDLWQVLISHSLSKPEYVTYLLQKIATYVDPRILVQKIEDNMEIPGLKNSLVKMMQDYNLQISFKNGCKKIVVSDCFNLHNRLVGLQQKGISIDNEICCNICHQKIISNNEHKNNIFIFNCHHSFHEDCLPSLNEKCIICHSQNTQI